MRGVELVVWKTGLSYPTPEKRQKRLCLMKLLSGFWPND